MAVSVAVCEIFSVKEWCDLENRVRVRSRSLEMAPFDKSHTSSQSHILERVVPTGPITMFQLLIGLIQSRDNRGRHVLSSETTQVEAYENGLMPV